MKTHWFPLIRPAVKPLFLEGWLTSHSPTTGQSIEPCVAKLLVPTILCSVYVWKLSGCRNFERLIKKTSNPKNPWTLQWKGWKNLYDAGVFFSGPQNSHWIEGSGFLGHEIELVVVVLKKMCCLPPTCGKCPVWLEHIFQMGWWKTTI